MKELLPYLAGAVSAFVVQFLIQVYVVPSTETHARRRERWEQHVLTLGELLSGAITDAAREARSLQSQLRWTQATMLGNKEYNQEFVERELSKLLLDARNTTRTFRDLITVRADWRMDRISMYRPSDLVIRFTQKSRLYWLHALTWSSDEWREMAEDDFDAWWDKEGKLRLEFQASVQKLADDPHPLRISLHQRARTIRHRAKRRLAKIRRKPAEPKPAAN